MLMQKFEAESGLLCNACLCLMSLVRGEGPACEVCHTCPHTILGQAYRQLLALQLWDVESLGLPAHASHGLALFSLQGEL